MTRSLISRIVLGFGVLALAVLARPLAQDATPFVGLWEGSIEVP